TVDYHRPRLQTSSYASEHADKVRARLSEGEKRASQTCKPQHAPPGDQVDHSAGQYASGENGVLISTNSVENYFAIVKRGHFGVHHHCSRKCLGQYLREFEWR